MKPSEPLITAWHQYLKTKTEATVARMKSIGMFKCSANDVELYNRANALAQKAIKLDRHADIEFRKALKKEYSKRFRIEWKDGHTCQVYVHERFSKVETVLNFNKSLRVVK